MAQPVEPMDTDDMSEFDNKENSIQHSNVPPHSTEKGYEELDVSELNMKLRYSFTPVSSPMTKSYAGNCLEDPSQESDDLNDTVVKEVGNLTHSLNSSTTQNNSTRTPKSLPLQSLPLDGTITTDNTKNVTVTITGTNDNEAIISFPSSSSSLTDTPEATTPVTEIPKPSGSPILRGLKSVLNMFRPSQSPIPYDERQTEEEVSSPPVVISPESNEDLDSRPETLLSSTPLSTTRRDCTKRGSPLKESLIFNDDLEKELAWKEENTILFSKEKIPIHKLFFQQPKPSRSENKPTERDGALEQSLNSSVEPMDISYNNSAITDHTLTNLHVDNISEVNEKDVTIGNTEKDESVFLDCETTFSMDISQALDATKEQLETEKLQLAAETNLDVSLSSQTAKQDDTNFSMFSAEFQPELEEISVTGNKEAIDASLIKVVNFYDTAPITDVLAPLPENLHDIEPTSAPLNEIINVIVDNTQDHKSLAQNKDDHDVLDSEEVPESIQKTLEETLNRMDGTQCFDDTVDVIRRIEAAIRQQDDEFMDAPANFEKEDFETTLANLVHNISSKDTTQMTDQSVNLTVKDLEAVNTSKSDVSYIAKNVPLPSESDDSQDENNTTVTAEIKMDTKINTDVLQTVIPEFPTEPFVEDIVRKNEEFANTTAEIEPVAIPATDITQTIPEVINSYGTITKEEVSAEPSNSEQLLQTDLVTTDTTVIEPSPLNTTIIAEIQASNTANTIVAQDLKNESQPESACINQAEVHNKLGSVIVTDIKELEQSPIEQTSITKIQETNIRDPSMEVNLKANATLKQVSPQLSENANTTNNAELILPNANLPQETNQKEDQEIVISESNSPFVSLSTDDENFSDAKKRDSNQENNMLPETTEENPVREINTLDSAVKVLSPPQSPKLSGKGSYNFNFDEMDDPFAMKGKIGMSPPPCAFDKTFDAIGKDRSSNERLDESPKVNTTVNLRKPMDESSKINSVCPDITVPQVLSSNELPLNTTADETSLKSDLTYDFNNLNMTHRVDDDLQADLLVVKNIPSDIDEQTFNVIDTKMKDDISSNVDDETLNVNKTEINEDYGNKTEDDQNQVHKQGVGMTPPLSPKLPGKGAYNFNFDEMDDPFAMKSKSTSSSLPDGLEKTIGSIDKADTSVNTSAKSPGVNTTINLNQTVDNMSKAGINVNPDTNGPQIHTVNETQMMKDNNDIVDKIEDETDEVYEEAKDDISEKELESLDDFAMEENKISAELNSTIQEKIKGTSSAEQSTYASAGTSLNEGTEPKLAQNFDDISNLFTIGSNIKQSVPPGNEETPFATRSKVRTSLVTSFIAAERQSLDANIATENANLEAKIASQEAELANNNKSVDKKRDDDKDGSETNCSGNSKDTDEKDVTMKEVLTEDEDTIEGPFIEALLGEETEKVTPDNMFGDSPKIALDIDMNQLTDLLAQPNEENFEAGEMFIDADAFEYLMNQNKSNELDENGKESLFLKFDPLFAKRMNSDGIVDALAKIQKRQSTPKKIKPIPRDLMPLDKSPVAGPSNAEMSGDESHEDVNTTVSQKPTMVVPPAVNPVPTPRQKVTTPTRANRLSMNFTSPAMAVIDRLLSMSANNSLVGQDTPAQVSRQVSREHTEADLALTQFRELLAEKEVNVHHLRCENKDLRNRLAAIESQMSSLQSESEKRLRDIEDLNNKLDEKDKMNKNMASVVEEYERTIAGLIAGIQEDKKSHIEERTQLIKERDEQTAHLSSMEVAFNDLHSKYEKSKQIIFSYKAKEDIYKKSIQEFEDNLMKMEKNYESLKQHATSKLNFANQELEKINKSHESEVLKLNAMLKRKDLHISSLEETLAQKSKANEELTAICDELINKVG